MFTLAKGFAGMMCGVQLNVLCWSTAQRSMQCVAAMVLHGSHRTTSSAATTLVESAMTKGTNLSHHTCGFGTSSAGFGGWLLPLRLG